MGVGVVRRKRRVRLHLVEDTPAMSLPTLEGLLVSRLHREYLLAVPSLLLAAGADPVTPQGRFVSVPKSRVAFFEWLD